VVVVGGKWPVVYLCAALAASSFGHSWVLALIVCEACRICAAPRPRWRRSWLHHWFESTEAALRSLHAVCQMPAQRIRLHRRWETSTQQAAASTLER
jgi:hypothetical protein